MNRRPRLRSSLVALLCLCAAPTAVAQVQSGPSTLDPLPVYTREADGRVIIRATRISQPPGGLEPLQNRGVIVKVNLLFRW